MAEISDSLGRVPIFAGLGRKELMKLGERISERIFKEGDTVTEQGAVYRITRRWQSALTKSP